VKATIATPEANGLATRMEKHFGHKVEVERRGGVVHVTIPAGRFELEPRDEELEVRLDPAAPDQLPRLREVVTTHLERLARSPIDVVWHEP
jgi:uncharacterized protein